MNVKNCVIAQLSRSLNGNIQPCPSRPVTWDRQATTKNERLDNARLSEQKASYRRLGAKRGLPIMGNNGEFMEDILEVEKNRKQTL